jgi:hypothetical protein
MAFGREITDFSGTKPDGSTPIYQSPVDWILSHFKAIHVPITSLPEINLINTFSTLPRFSMNFSH